MKASAPVTGRRMRTVRAVRGAHPGCFALVMSTGIVSAALRQAGSPRSPAVAACDVPGTGSPADGQYAAVLAAAGRLARLGLTCLVPGHRALPAITATGTCGAVGTR